MGADLVIIDANVITMHSAKPQAQAIAVKGGKIVDVGATSAMKRWIDAQTRIINLKGKTVVPGLIDTHAHMITLGSPLPMIDLRGVHSIREIKRRLAAKVKETGRGRWIQGRGWDQDRLKEKRYPTKWDLDRVSPENPVMLKRVCGHIGVANSKALKIAKIDADETASLGNLVSRDPKTGEPTGILLEGASDVLWDLPEPSEEDLRAACGRACAEAVKVGLTSVTWLVYKPNEVHALKKLRRQGKLPLRINVMIPIEYFRSFRDKALDDQFLRQRCVKIFTDGSLGARTAALEKPYADEPSTKGVLYYSQEELSKLISEVDNAGYQAALHAIGDLALGQALEAFKTMLNRERIAKMRHRIEHASILNPKLIRQIKKLGLIVCVQPHFVVSDFWVEDRLGHERARWTYALKSMVESGILIAASSDAPAEPLNPILGLWAAVARESFPEERLSVRETLEAYTINAAYFSFEEDVKGSIAVGKYADLTVLSHDPFKVEPERIRDIRVEMTIVDGKVVYSALD